ncbi:hypothetical protein OH77DRAFT_1488941 [Trametes cingulata]|nr:hypothetical protein OH77DRAFT_1488941 [Trametes cingulata]
MTPTSYAGLDTLRRPSPRLTPASLPVDPPSPVPVSPPARTPSPRPAFETRANRFGVFRHYTTLPAHDPEEGLTLDAFTSIRTHTRPASSLLQRTPVYAFGAQALRIIKDAGATAFAPFANITTFRLMHWLYSGSNMKTPSELNRLIHDVILAPEFHLDHVSNFNACRENERLDAHVDKPEAFAASDGWREGEVRIRLPKERVRHSSEEAAPELVVSGVYHRSLLELVKAACQDTPSKAFHWVPFKLFHRQKSPTAEGAALPASPPPPERLYGDAYTADAMIEEHEKIQVKARQDREPGDTPDTEYAAVPLLLSSDSTHLTNFGSAALWPIYVFFASLSKYVRACPSSFSAHHLAYIPSLPLTVQKAYQDVYGEPASAAVLRFCKRELMQQIWLLLLDDDFIKAYVHGILIQYKAKIHLMGTVNDMHARTTNIRKDTSWLQSSIAAARRNIFQFGAPPEGSTVEGILGATSTTPTRSAFSIRLAQFGFDIYRILVPDLLHEFELGVWKATITHLVRILIAAGGRSVQELDKRFSDVPTFGRETIRRFGANISGFKKLAARDYEDLLQCALPVFEGLLPPHCDKVVLDMIFTLATWHALAKLRLHSESTLSILEQITKALGGVMRKFQRDVCPEYHTKELPKETIARHRRAKPAPLPGRHASTSQNPRHPESSANGTTGAAVPPKHKSFNMNTYKFHRLGDYVDSIRNVGTTENSTTQTSELEHRRLKRFYARTNKNARFAWQIARHQRRERALHRLHAQTSEDDASAKRRSRNDHSSRAKAAFGRRRPLNLGFTSSEPLAPASPRQHTQISEGQEHPVDIGTYVHENRHDPAFKDFAQRLQVHVYRRLVELRTGKHHESDITPRQLRSLRIQRNRMYLHKVMRVNYTSYDMRREQDSVNPRSHADILMLAPPGDTHPYLYARVISIFHVNAFLLGPNDTEADPELIHVLWIRWFEVDTSVPAGFEARRPYRLRFAQLDEEPFTFIAPSQVLRGVHIIPAFHHGRSDVALPYASVTRGADCANDDYKYYYVGMWSDRDLFMRFLGGGVGHQQHTLAASQRTLIVETEGETAHTASLHDEEALRSPLAHEVPGPRLEEEVSGSDSDSDDPEGGYYPSADEDTEDGENYESGGAPLDAPGLQNHDDHGEDSEADDVLDLGPEDGEGDYELDDVEYAGFAPL